MIDRGEPISYMVLSEGTPVALSDGSAYGEVKRVLAAEDEDIFDGLILDTPDGDRFVDAPRVAGLYERQVVLSIAREQVDCLPEPTRNPAALGVDPDDTSADDAGDKLRHALRRAWDRVSGNY